MQSSNKTSYNMFKTLAQKVRHCFLTNFINSRRFYGQKLWSKNLLDMLKSDKKNQCSILLGTLKKYILSSYACSLMCEMD